MTTILDNIEDLWSVNQVQTILGYITLKNFEYI